MDARSFISKEFLPPTLIPLKSAMYVCINHMNSLTGSPGFVVTSKSYVAVTGRFSPLLRKILYLMLRLKPGIRESHLILIPKQLDRGTAELEFQSQILLPVLV